MKVNAKVTLNKAAIQRLGEAQKQALEMTAEAIKTDVVTSAVVPKQSGELERSAHVDNSELAEKRVKIVFDTPYARRLYWHPEYNFRTDKNPNARGKWLEQYQSGEKLKFAQETFRKFLKQQAKGLIK